MAQEDPYRDKVCRILATIPDQDFTVLDILGSTPSSTVVLARNNKLGGRLEAIKILESVEPNLREQFIREGRVYSVMRHESIPKVYDIFEHCDYLLFRTEYIDGYSLQDVLRMYREHKIRFPEKAATKICYKLLWALSYAHNQVIYEGHQRTIIHCDIKPSNILLSPVNYIKKGAIEYEFKHLIEGAGILPHLIDFGIVGITGYEQPMQGTLNYMSPQQVSQEGVRIDWRTDIYQLLLVYSEMLSGEKPYEGLGRNEIISNISERDSSVPKSSRIPKDMRQFIEKGTKRKPEESFKTERECLDAFSRIMAWRKRKALLKQTGKVLALCLLAFLLILSGREALQWRDYSTNSVDALAIGLGNNPTHEEMEVALGKIQARAFEKKYYEPLLKGVFRDADGNPAYPDHLSPDGSWALTGSSDEGAGAFAGLLFIYASRYPGLIDYAREYAEPLLNSSFDGSNNYRFYLAMAPAYEATGDKRYLEKLEEIAAEIQSQLGHRKGMRSTQEMFDIEMFLWLYKTAGQPKYLAIGQATADEFIRINIDDDGYVFETALVNATTPYGKMPDMKINRAALQTENFTIGQIVDIPMDMGQDAVKNITSVWSSEYLQAIRIMHQLYTLTGTEMYREKLTLLLDYYYQSLPDDGMDCLLVACQEGRSGIPKDSLAAVRDLQLNREIMDFRQFMSIPYLHWYAPISSRSIRAEFAYYRTLRTLLGAGYLRRENENGVLSGSILLLGKHYDDADRTMKNQSLAITDRLFLELGAAQQHLPPTSQRRYGAGQYGQT